MTDRQSFVGGSDLGDVLAIEPWGCQLRAWLRKRGEFAEAEPTAPMQRGSKLEAVIADEYRERTGRKLRNRGMIVPTINHTCDYLRAHPDRDIVGFDSRGPGLLSIKCLGLFRFRKVRREGLPQEYVAQLQYELLLAARLWGSYAIFNAELWDMHWWDVDYDPALAKGIIQLVHKFWATVENGPAPAKLDATSRVCARCAHRPVCHPDVLPVFDGETQRDDSLLPLLEQRREALNIVSDAEEYRDGINELLRQQLRGRARVESGRYLVTQGSVPAATISYTRKAFARLAVYERSK